jgi:hypothetical protein
MGSAKHVFALWHHELQCKCPHCDLWVELLELGSFWESKPAGFRPGDRLKDTTGECPKCRNTFKLSIVPVRPD